VPEWIVDVEARTAILDLTESSDLALEAIEPLLQSFTPYYEVERIRHVVVRLRSSHPIAIDVLVQGLRAQSKAVGINFSIEALE
jgi:hypothetical protein